MCQQAGCVSWENCMHFSLDTTPVMMSRRPLILSAVISLCRAMFPPSLRDAVAVAMLSVLIVSPSGLLHTLPAALAMHPRYHSTMHPVRPAMAAAGWRLGPLSAGCVRVSVAPQVAAAAPAGLCTRATHTHQGV